YRNNMVTPTDYAQVIWSMAKAYNNAAILIEINIALGSETAKIIYQDLEYDNMIFTTNRGARGKIVTTSGGPNVDMGLKTTKPSKASGCSMLKLLIEQDQYLIQDFNTIEELNRFSKTKKGTYEAEDGCNDDTVMGLVLFAWLSNQDYFRNL